MINTQVRLRADQATLSDQRRSLSYNLSRGILCRLSLSPGPSPIRAPGPLAQSLPGSAAERPDMLDTDSADTAAED